MDKIIIFIFLACLPFVIFSQKERSIIREGNKLYKDSLYAEALNKYLDAIAENPENTSAKYNLANALYKNQKYNEAEKLYEELVKNKDVNQEDVYYNLGNTLTKKQEYAKAVDYYKKTLRINPNHKNARYNLSYALSQLKNEENNNKNNKDKGDKNNQDKNGKDDKDKNNGDNKNDEGENGKDKNDKNENKSDKNKNENNSDKQSDSNKNSPKPNDLSKEEAEKMLNNLEDNDKKLLQKLIQQQMQKQNYNSDKDW